MVDIGSHEASEPQLLLCSDAPKNDTSETAAPREATCPFFLSLLGAVFSVMRDEPYLQRVLSKKNS